MDIRPAPRRLQGPGLDSDYSCYWQRQQAAHIRIIWGQYLFERELCIPDGPLSLTHRKTNLGSIPLQINVEPSATVTVGQGPPPDEERVNIDEGWTRLAGAPIYR